MKKIIVTTAPPGFAPENIREQWVGVELPVEDELGNGSGFRTGAENSDGYRVNSFDALKALKAAEKNEAFEFWELRLSPKAMLVFKKEFCDEL